MTNEQNEIIHLTQRVRKLEAILGVFIEKHSENIAEIYKKTEISTGVVTAKAFADDIYSTSEKLYRG